MSELKAISSGEIYNIIEYEGSCITDDLYYPKSEADKVIAEQEKEARHHKYKRCMAMRNMCRYAQYWYSYLMEYESCKIRPNNIDFSKYNKKYHFYIRWRKRWLNIAKQKEVK